MCKTFSEVAGLWKQDKRKWVKKSSYATYLRMLQVHLEPYFIEVPIAEEAVQAYADTKLSEGLSLKTVRDSLIVLKMILRYGEKLGEWPHLEFAVHFPTSAFRKKEVPTLGVKEQHLLVRYLQENFSFRNLGLLLCLQSGMRIGEVCALQWSDLDMDGGVIHISKTVQRIWLSDGALKENELVVGCPKTLTSVREIPLSREMLRILRLLRKVMRPDYYLVSNSPEPLEPRYYRAYFKKVLELLGIPPLRFHALRHTFATRCIEGKCDYKTVSVILGHASIATTLDLYVHPGYADKKRCIDRMSKVIGE